MNAEIPECRVVDDIDRHRVVFEGLVDEVCVGGFQRVIMQPPVKAKQRSKEKQVEKQRTQELFRSRGRDHQPGNTGCGGCVLRQRTARKEASTEKENQE